MEKWKCFVASLLLWTSIVQAKVLINIEHACKEMETIAEFETCLVPYRQARDSTNLFFEFVFRDACALKLSSCFYDPTNEIYDCTYDPDSLAVTCACPNEGVAWTDGRIDETYVAGRICNDIDECAAQTDACDPFRTTCNNLQGSYECVCKEGYAPDGDYTCTSVEDPCILSSPCSTFATCQSITREQGCFDAAANLPAGSADLTSLTLTAFECMKFCYDLGKMYAAATGGTDCYCTNDEPTNPQATSNCDISCGPTENELCGNSAKTFANYYAVGAEHRCTCNDGYVGDGVNCTEGDNCVGVTIPEHATCTSLFNDYKISCLDGYIMDGSGNCVTYSVIECDQIDSIETDEIYNRQEAWAPDCSRVQLRNCDGSGEVEEVSAGNASRTSKCVDGKLVGDFGVLDISASDFLSNRSWEMLTPLVDCGQSLFTLVVDRAVLNAYGYSLSNLALGDFPLDMDPNNYPSECRGRRYYDLYGPRYIFDHDFSDKCGVEREIVSRSIETLTFTLTGVKGTKTELFNNQATLKYRMTCTYNKALAVSDDTFYVFDSLRRRKRALSTPGQLVLVAKSDATFSSALDASKPLKKGAVAYLEVDLPGLDRNYALQWLQCWQSDSGNPREGKKRVFLQDGCSASNGDKLDNSVTIYKNSGTKSQLAFYPTSFTGGESEEIYVHCMVNKCDLNGDQTCSQVCDVIGGDGDASLNVLATTETVTSGRILLRDVCGGSDNGGCEQLCSVSDDEEAVCGCVTGFQVDPENPRSCKGIPASYKSGSQGAQWYYIVVPVMALILIVAALLVASKARESKSKAYKTPDFADLTDDA